jgi:hypothetical protein
MVERLKRSGTTRRRVSVRLNVVSRLYTTKYITLFTLGDSPLALDASLDAGVQEKVTDVG